MIEQEELVQLRNRVYFLESDNAFLIRQLTTLFELMHSYYSHRRWWEWLWPCGAKQFVMLVTPGLKKILLERGVKV